MLGLADLTNPDVVVGDCAINYAEFAVDFTTDDNKTLKKLVRFFNRHLVRIPSKRSKDSRYHNDDFAETAYLSAKGDKERLVFYSDKPARNAQGQLRLHVEFRLAGWTLLKKLNILTIRDLIDFDHQQLWDAQLDLRKPNLTQLGVAYRNGDTSRQADHKRGVKEWQAIKSLQQYLCLHPAREPAFTKMTHEKLGQYLHDFWKKPY